MPASRADFRADWQEVPDNQAYDNAFKAQWELFLRHVCGERQRFRWNLLEGAKGVQLAELGYRSWPERRMARRAAARGLKSLPSHTPVSSRTARQARVPDAAPAPHGSGTTFRPLRSAHVPFKSATFQPLQQA